MAVSHEHKITAKSGIRLLGIAIFIHIVRDEASFRRNPSRSNDFILAGNEIVAFSCVVSRWLTFNNKAMRRCQLSVGSIVICLQQFGNVSVQRLDNERCALTGQLVFDHLHPILIHNRDQSRRARLHRSTKPFQLLM